MAELEKLEDLLEGYENKNLIVNLIQEAIADPNEDLRKKAKEEILKEGFIRDYKVLKGYRVLNKLCLELKDKTGVIKVYEVSGIPVEFNREELKEFQERGFGEK